MSLSHTTAAVRSLLQELDTKIAAHPHSLYRATRRAQRERLQTALGLLESGQHALLEPQGLHRLCAFTILKLPAELDQLPQVLAELRVLGFDQVGLTASSVFEQAITGADFA